MTPDDKRRLAEIRENYGGGGETRPDKWLERSRRMIGCEAECHTMGCACRLYAAALLAAHREGFGAGREAAAQIIERHPEEHPMQPFEGDIQECCRVMAASVRDTACPDPVEKEARDGSAKGTPA